MRSITARMKATVLGVGCRYHTPVLWQGLFCRNAGVPGPRLKLSRQIVPAAAAQKVCVRCCPAKRCSTHSVHQPHHRSVTSTESAAWSSSLGWAACTTAERDRPQCGRQVLSIIVHCCMHAVPVAMRGSSVARYSEQG